jgi:hypothetical protein
MEAHYSEVSHYSSLCSHLRDLRERLTLEQRRDLDDYLLPEMPSRFLERYVPTRPYTSLAVNAGRPRLTC